MEPIKQTIKIRIASFVVKGRRVVEVAEYREQAADVYGNWAVFKDGRKWNVTYTPDGLRLALFPTKKAAVYVANRLAEELKASPYESTIFMKVILSDVITEYGASGVHDR